MLSHTGGTEQNKTFSTTKKHEFTRKKTKPMRWISLPVAISFTARGCSVVIPMSDQSLTIMIRNLAMDFGYKPQGDMDIVRGFMAKIGDKGQAFVNQ
jgi:hypothetical protein